MVQHYWNHVEFFPMHIALPASVEEELIAILSHAAIGEFGPISALWFDLCTDVLLARALRWDDVGSFNCAV
jgi:hypothetical protein